jgi:hypothetical protein
MSAPEKLDPARGWLFVEKLLADEEIERMANMSDEEIEREAAAEEPPLSRVPSAEELFAKVDAARAEPRVVPSVAIPEEPRRFPRVVWLCAAALAFVAAVVLVQRDAVVALFRAPIPAPSPTHEPEPTPEQRAALVRVEAQKACAAGEWTACEAKLDEAAKIDPAGESSPAVQEMRKSILQGQLRENELEAKPRRK